MTTFSHTHKRNPAINHMLHAELSMLGVPAAVCECCVYPIIPITEPNATWRKRYVQLVAELSQRYLLLIADYAQYMESDNFGMSAIEHLEANVTLAAAYERLYDSKDVAGIHGDFGELSDEWFARADGLDGASHLMEQYRLHNIFNHWILQRIR